MDQERLNKIISILKEKNVNQPCQRCGTKSFNVVDESVIPIQTDPNVISFGGPSIPTVIVACKNCGFIMQHALGPLGLIRGEKNEQ